MVLPLARPTLPLAWTDLQGQPLLLFPAQHSCDIEIHQHLNTFLPPGTVVQEVTEDEVMLSMVEHGLGLAILPRLAVMPLRESLMVRPGPACTTAQGARRRDQTGPLRVATCSGLY